jgi:hypothetical protein
MLQIHKYFQKYVILIVGELTVNTIKKHLWQRGLFSFCESVGMYLDEQCTTAKSAVRENV